MSKPITGVATGSLGTGTAVTDETTLMATPALAEPAATAQRAGFLRAARAARSGEATPRSGEAAPRNEPAAPRTVPAAVVRPEATGALLTEPAARERRDPYRPIGIALAAILVALAGVALFADGGGGPAEAVAPPGATVTPAPTDAGDDQGGDDAVVRERGDGGNANGHGGGNGRGQGNGHDNGNGHGGRD